MDKTLKAAYAASRHVSKVGSIVMVIPIALMCISIMACLLAFVRIGVTDVTPLVFWVCKLLSMVTVFACYMFMQRFLWCFSKGESPFDYAQIHRLIACGCSFILEWVFQFRPLLTKNMVVLEEPIIVELAKDNKPSLLPLFVGIFILCVAAILRYAAALKEDSDSIL